MLLATLFILISIFIIYYAGDYCIESSLKLAKYYNVSPLFIGIFILSFGTSLPEFFLSLLATWQNSPDISVGNIVGSNITNFLIAMGIPALIMPLVGSLKILYRDFLFMSLVGILLFGYGYYYHQIDFTLALIFLLITVIYFIVFYFSDQNKSNEETDENSLQIKSIFLLHIVFILSLMGILLGAYLLLEGALKIVAMFGLAQTFVGLTITAIGTSLPEIVVSIFSIKNRNSELMLGNIIGSCFFNIAIVFGIIGIFHTIPIDPNIVLYSLPVMLGIYFFVFLILLFTRNINRFSGIFFLITYICYLVVLYKNFS